MSKIIETTVPIPVAQLREIIGDPDVKVIIDLSQSSVKPLQALIYLSNLELGVDVVFAEEDRLDVLDAYLKLPTLLKCPALETMMLELILHLKGIIHVDYVDLEWCEERRETISKWASLLDSLVTYIPQIIESDEMKMSVEQFPENDTDNMLGINFVNLFDNELFPLVFSHIDWNLVRNYTRYFNDYMYKGHNLFYFWASPENAVHVMTMALIDDDVATDDEFSMFTKHLDAISEKEAE